MEFAKIFKSNFHIAKQMCINRLSNHVVLIPQPTSDSVK